MMNKMKYLPLAIVILGSFALAGGDLTPLDEAETDVLTVNSSGVYIGTGIGTMAVNFDFYGEEFSAKTMMLQAGYAYSQYAALEARVTFGCCSDYDTGSNTNVTAYNGTMSSWGMYVKPMYPINDFSVYGLLGYGGVMISELNGGDAYESGFQWGLGMQYAYTERMSVFVDYLSLYDDAGFDYVGATGNVDSDTWTIGLNYRF